MFWFSIKKSFWITWDNLGKVLLLNFIYFVLFLGYISLLIINNTWIVVLPLFAVILGIYHSFTAFLVAEWNNFRSITIKAVKERVKKQSKIIFLYSVLFCVVIIFSFVAISFYLNPNLNSFIGLLGSVLLFWFICFIILMNLYFWSVQSRFSESLKSLVKKSCLFVLGNPLFSLGLGCFCLLLIGVSFFALLLLPSVVGIHILVDNCVKYILKKYYFLEEATESFQEKRYTAKIPWKDLLFEEEQSIGKRSFRGMIFPWKE